jgi:hypothetical protein
MLLHMYCTSLCIFAMLEIDRYDVIVEVVPHIFSELLVCWIR